MDELERAVMESARFAAMESYFEARPQIAITRKLECVFEAGFDAAYAEVRRLRGEVDQLRCQLAGCGVAALKNTVSSRSRRAIRGDYGHSASYEDVCNAVDREIALREENERLRGWIREEGDRNNTCIRPILHETCKNCGCNQAAIDAARSAKTPPEPAP